MCRCEGAGVRKKYVNRDIYHKHEYEKMKQRDLRSTTPSVLKPAAQPCLKEIQGVYELGKRVIVRRTCLPTQPRAGPWRSV